MVADERFKGQVEDPRFRLVPKKKRKVKIDERFKSLLDENSSFSRKTVIDKYGRKVKHESKEDLKRFYHMDEEDEEGEERGDSDGENAGKAVQEKKGGKKVLKGEKGKEMKKDLKPKGDKDKKSDKATKGKTSENVSAKLQHKDLREAMLDWTESSSEDEDEEEDNFGVDEKLFSEAIDVSQPVLPVTETIQAGEETRRLAVVNLDWKRVKAVDLLVLLRSFAPSNGEVTSVKIYPSEFGKERMEKEKHEGPAQYLGIKSEDQDDSEDDNGGGDEEEVDMVKLRRYEAEKLKYFYAVVECDSARTAKCIYAMCDGVEYEASANVIDLRYIPDEEEFEESEVHAVATSVPSDYVSPFFINNAMGHTKVKLSWDEDDPSRDVLHGKGLPGGKKKKKGKKEKEMQMIDYSQFIATSDEEEDEEERREKAREALLGAAKSSASVFGKQGDEKATEDVVVTFTPGLSSIGDQLLRNKQVREEESEMTVWDKYQKKRAEKKKEKRMKKGEKGDEEEKLDESELPAGSEFVDDSVFENDPFFQIPDEEEEEDRGMWKRGKGNKGKGKNPQKQMEQEEEEERKARERQQLELLMMDDANEGKRGYSIKHSALGRASQLAGEEVTKKKKKKGKKKGEKEEGEGEREDSFKLDLNDPRFASVYSDPKFALDPTDPQFRKTPGLSKLMKEGQDRRSKRNHAETEGHANGKAGQQHQQQQQQQQQKRSRLDPSISSLVSTLKSRGKKA
ncbi:hypothetical protein GUITHDRAFT_99451 [Guillardia theta CCMP2712]|uniref:Uncharacterized protein n=2 Tax=Guillardia theta TaxID=55529 RepID=L1K1W2_GUITC|nr:hypothetical protein GUITHDRAFT_99451 [Guillardia theta CCMP2712]EKX54801.1 hypothetical protein GUITHDRAFT_99451 [Guillardia theta CCMP2712]|eukprot:XP_005841781.1 hypothetical protein GUITHDRAFT_99451 [Guillardia theta CCMP2712]